MLVHNNKITKNTFDTVVLWDPRDWYSCYFGSSSKFIESEEVWSDPAAVKCFFFNNLRTPQRQWSHGNHRRYDLSSLSMIQERLQSYRWLQWRRCLVLNKLARRARNSSKIVSLSPTRATKHFHARHKFINWFLFSTWAWFPAVCLSSRLWFQVF